jgi:hypothetical protein
VQNLIFHPIQHRVSRRAFEYKKEEVTGNKSVGFDCLTNILTVIISRRMITGAACGIGRDD